MSNPEVDASVIAAASGGEDSSGHASADDAFEALLAALYAPVRSFLLRRLRSFPDAPDLAEDVTQEALLRIARGIAGCRATTDRQVMAWALTTAHHTLANTLRSRASAPLIGRVGVSLSGLERTLMGEEGEAGETRLSRGGARLLDLLVHLLHALTDEQLLLVEMHVWERSPWEEIGARVGLSAGAAKMRCRRTLRRLGRSLERAARSLPDGERTVVGVELAQWLDRPVLGTASPRRARDRTPLPRSRPASNDRLST